MPLIKFQKLANISTESSSKESENHSSNFIFPKHSYNEGKAHRMISRSDLLGIQSLFLPELVEMYSF